MDRRPTRGSLQSVSAAHGSCERGCVQCGGVRRSFGETLAGGGGGVLGAASSITKVVCAWMIWLSACAGDVGPASARPGLSGAPTNATTCDATGCQNGLSCAIYCSGNQTRFDCHTPGPTDVPVGANCLGRSCSSGVCVTPPPGAGSISECLSFCKLDSDCRPGYSCQASPVYFNCNSTKADTIWANVCRRKL
jgi:hypothetical protein